VTIDQVINALVMVTLVEMMATIGLGVSFADVRGVARDWRLVGRAALANYVCVPAVVVGLLVLFGSAPMVAAGFLIVAVCPGAPYGPPFTALARGDVPRSVGLMVILAGSSAFVAPELLLLLLPLLAGDQPLRVDAVKIVTTLLVTQLLPLGAGLLVRHRRPALADRLKRPATLVGTVLNLVTFGLILAVQYPTLLAIRPTGFVGMFILLALTVAAGWLLGGPGGEARRAMAFTTGVRNAAVSLVIATASFPGTEAVTAALAYALVQTIVLALVALVCGRLAAGARPAAAAPVAGLQKPAPG
jgi:BASS family bile acid:Na+ symporter